MKEYSTSYAFTDSKNAITNAQSPPGWLQEALRHVKTHFSFFKQYVQDGTIILNHCPGTQQVADLLTKGFSKAKPGADNQKADAFRKLTLQLLGMQATDDASTNKRRRRNS